MDKVICRNINWNLFLTHPLELIKLDTSLKLKTSELNQVVTNGRYHQTPNNWSDLIEFEMRKHLRLIYNFRCFLQIMAKDILYFNFPDSHRMEIKHSWTAVDEDRLKTLSEIDIPMEVNTLNDNVLFLLISSALDYDKTKKIFRDAMFKLFQKLQITCNREVLDMIIAKVNFGLKFEEMF